MWDTVSEYKKACTGNDVRLAEVLRSIEVKGRAIVERPLESAAEGSDGQKVIEKSLGGIDAFLTGRFEAEGLGAGSGETGPAVIFDLLNEDMTRKTNRTAVISWSARGATSPGWRSSTGSMSGPPGFSASTRRWTSG